MAIIYTYPTKATPANDDLILISDSADSNKTKQVTVASIKGQTAGVTSIVAGNNVTISSTGASGTGDVTINASGGGTFSVQDSGGTAITGIDTLDFNTNLSVSHSLGSSTVTINASGSGPGTGTEDTVPIWSTTSTLGDSLITQNAGATVLNVGTNIASFSTTAGVGSVFATRVSVNGYSTFGGKLKLNSPDGATFVEIEGPANGGAAYTLKLPSSAPGDNQILQYTTSGNLGWINTPTGTTYNIMGSGNSYAAGLVLAGNATHNNEFLRKDGTWQTAGGAVTSYTNANNNYILTSSGASSINGESSLLYNGSTLTLGTSKVFNASRSTVTAGVATAPIYVTNSTLSSGAPTNFASNIAGGNGSRHIEFYHGGTSVGSITSTSTNIVINGEASDERKKKNIVDWTENVLDKFALIEPKKFNFTHQDDSDPLIKGFIAQQMVDKFPEAYNHDYSISDTEGYYSFNAMGMNVYLMKAIKELKEEIDNLKSRISTLEG
jgi:hypothetical protein